MARRRFRIRAVLVSKLTLNLGDFPDARAVHN